MSRLAQYLDKEEKKKTFLENNVLFQKYIYIRKYKIVDNITRTSCKQTQGCTDWDYSMWNTSVYKGQSSKSATNTQPFHTASQSALKYKSGGWEMGGLNLECDALWVNGTKII